MRHSKRTVLTADDVDSALNLRNVEVFFYSNTKKKSTIFPVLLIVCLSISQGDKYSSFIDFLHCSRGLCFALICMSNNTRVFYPETSCWFAVALPNFVTRNACVLCTNVEEDNFIFKHCWTLSICVSYYTCSIDIFQ